nr:keratin-associated protein 10-4-like [Caretta caretta]
MVYQQQCKQTCLPPPCCVTKCTTKCLDPCCKVCVTKCVTKCVDPCCKVCVKKCTTCVHPCPCPCPQKCIPCPPCPPCLPKCPPVQHCCKEKKFCSAAGVNQWSSIDIHRIEQVFAREESGSLPTSRKMVYQHQCKQTCLPPPCCVTKCTTKCLDPCCKVCVTKCVTKCVDPCCKVCVKKCTTCVHPCPCPCPEKCAPCPPCFPKCPPVEHCCKEKKFCGTCFWERFQSLSTYCALFCLSYREVNAFPCLPTSRKMVYQHQCKQTCLPPPCCVTKCTTKCLDPCCKVCVTKCVTKCVDPCCKVCVKKCTTCVHPCPCPCPEKCPPCPPCFPKCPPVEHCCKEKKFCSAAGVNQWSSIDIHRIEQVFAREESGSLPTSRKMVYQHQCKQTCLPPPCCVTKCTTKCLDPCCKVCVTKCVTKCVDPCCKVCVKKCTTCVHPCPCPCPEKCPPCPPCFPKCPPVEHCCKEKKFW